MASWLAFAVSDASGSAAILVWTVFENDPVHLLSICAQVDEEQFKKIMNYIDQGKAEGAKLNCGGKRKGDKGFYVEPTVFSEVSIVNLVLLHVRIIHWPMQSFSKCRATCLFVQTQQIDHLMN